MKWIILFLCSVGCCNTEIDLTDECDPLTLPTVAYDGRDCLDGSNCAYWIESGEALCQRAGQRIRITSGVMLVCEDDLRVTCEEGEAP